MALLLTAEEDQLRDSVRRFAAERSPLAKLRELMSSGQPYDAEVWKQLSAQLGLTGLIIDEEYGGAGAGYAAMAVALAELGAGLVASPLLAVTLAAGALPATRGRGRAARPAPRPGQRRADRHAGRDRAR